MSDEYIDVQYNESTVKAQLKNYERTEDPIANIEIARRFLLHNCMSMKKDDAFDVIKLQLVNHFRLDNKSISTLKEFWVDENKKRKSRKSELVISISKDIGGTLRDISITMSYDNRPGFVQNTWLAELLLDGQQVAVPIHSYAEEFSNLIEDSTAIVRAQADIINSKLMVSELTSFLVYATNLSEAEASGIINEVVEIATGRDKEIYRLCPQISSEMDRINAEKHIIDNKSVEVVSDETITDETYTEEAYTEEISENNIKSTHDAFDDAIDEIINHNIPNNQNIINKQNSIQERLKNYKRVDDPMQNVEVAKQFVTDYFSNESKTTLTQAINFYLKSHFQLDNGSVKILNMHWSDIQKIKKELKKVDDAKQNNNTKNSVKEAQRQEEEEARLENERIREENERIRTKRQNRITELYDILRNKSGENTIADIENAKLEIKEKMMPEFWTVEGFNEKTGNMGHLSLKKLAIADYIQKAFNIVKFGGRLWWYDWEKAFYTYDSEDVYIQKEIADIMRTAGDDDFYKYNGNSITDTATIIHLASTVNVFTENPFNKHTGYINAKNGVLKLDYVNKKVKLLGKKPEYMFSYCIDTIYEPTAVDTEIHKALGENLGDVQRELIYQMAAIAIRDTDPKLIPSKIAYLFIGPRNTGKNVVMQILNDFFGNPIVSRIPLIEIAENKFVKPLLEGKVINLDDELPEHLPLTESREIKSLTGGKFHTLEPKNVKPYSGVITALLVFAGNQFPKCSISKNDTAFWDRWEIISFNKKQHDVDEDFLSKLLTANNLSGFFNRVIDKLFAIHGHKIKRKQGGFDTYDEWLHSSSTVYRFYQEMTADSNERVDYNKEEFYKYYNDWCEAAGIPRENRAATLPEFGRELSQTCHVKEGRLGTEDRHYVYRMFKRYEPGLLAISLSAIDEPEMYVVTEEPYNDLEPPEEVWTLDDDGIPVREFIYKQ